MKDIREIKPDNFGGRRQNALVVHHEANGGLVKVNRVLFCIVLLLLTIIMLFGFSLIPSNNLVKQFVNNQVVAERGKVVMNPVVAEQINVLKSQMVGLVSGAIESKLRILELSIKSGSVTNADLGLIKELRKDFTLFSSFSDLEQARLFGAEHEKVSEMRQAERLIQEVTQLKMMIYITLASCGLMLAAVGGVWLQTRYLLGYERKLLKANRLAGDD